VRGQSSFDASGRHDGDKELVQMRLPTDEYSDREGSGESAEWPLMLRETSAPPSRGLCVSLTVDSGINTWGIEVMSSATATVFDPACTTVVGDLRGRLVEASVGYHRANEAVSRAYDETDRLAEEAGRPLGGAWRDVVADRERAVLRSAHERCREAGGRWEAIAAEVLGDDGPTGRHRLFSSEEVAALLAFVAGESSVTV
jgi:hypothetical protein